MVNRCWSQSLLSAIDPSGKLRDCLPGLLAADEPAGLLRPEIAEQFGLSDEVLVSSGGGDNMMAAIGTGNVVPGVVTASLGTSGTIYAYAERPVVDDSGELADSASLFQRRTNSVAPRSHGSPGGNDHSEYEPAEFLPSGNGGGDLRTQIRA